MNGYEKRRISNDKIIQNVNKWGYSFKDERRCYVYVCHERRLRYRLYVKVKSLNSGKESWSLYDNLKKGKSPFFEKTQLNTLELINNIGKKLGFICTKIIGEKRRTMKLHLYFSSLNKTFIGNYSSVIKGHLPLSYSNTIQKQQITKKITKLGLSLPRKERFFPIQVFKKGSHYKAVIQHVESNKKHELWCEDLIFWKKSPFRLFYNNEEKNKVHIIFKKELSKINLIYDYEKIIAKGSRIDFVVEIYNKKIGIEVKSDNKFWSSKSINEQMLKYIESNQLDMVILASPQGKYGLSFKDTINYLQGIINED